MNKTQELTGLVALIKKQLVEFGIEGIIVKELIFEYPNKIKEVRDDRTEECRIVRNPVTGELEYKCPD